MPESYIDFREESVTSGDVPVVGLRSADQILFLDSNENEVAYQKADNLAAHNNWWAVKDGQNVEVREPDGRLRLRIPIPGIPYAIKGQLFISDEWAGMLFKVNPYTGDIYWKREFITQVTALDVNEDNSLIGLLDGRCLLIDDKGKTLLEYRPGGSRIEVIYGVALSSDGLQIALIAGLDPQKIILLKQKKEQFYPVTYHVLDTNFRSYVALDFVQNSRYVYYIADGYLNFLDTANYQIGRHEYREKTLSWIFEENDELLIVLGARLSEGSLSLYTKYAMPLFHDSLPLDLSYIKNNGNKFYITGDKRGAVIQTRLL